MFFGVFIGTMLLAGFGSSHWTLFFKRNYLLIQRKRMGILRFYIKLIKIDIV